MLDLCFLLGPTRSAWSPRANGKLKKNNNKTMSFNETTHSSDCIAVNICCFREAAATDIKEREETR